jgi:hypothetical protein
MALNVTKIITYIPSPYPTLPDGVEMYTSREFSRVAQATSSVASMLKAAAFGVTKKSGVPVVADLPAGTSGIFKDTSGGGVYLAYNDDGTIKKVALT